MSGIETDNAEILDGTRNIRVVLRLTKTKDFADGNTGLVFVIEGVFDDLRQTDVGHCKSLRAAEQSTCAVYIGVCTPFVASSTSITGSTSCCTGCVEHVAELMNHHAVNHQAGRTSKQAVACAAHTGVSDVSQEVGVEFQVSHLLWSYEEMEYLSLIHI